jgi:integrase/recombinase XerD
MSISKQAKVLSENQIKAMLAWLEEGRNGQRNSVIFLLSVKAGLRAKEVASLTWEMVLNSEGVVGSTLNLTNAASKGKSGRVVPLNTVLARKLTALHQLVSSKATFSTKDRVVRTERSKSTSPQVIVNMFADWYRSLKFVGASSHSGRRTFITNAARKISTVGGSLNDIRILAGHSNLATTQRYIEFDTDAQRKIVNLV